MNRSFKRIFAYESLMSRRLFGAFELLGKAQRMHKGKCDHRERMRLVKRHKKTNVFYSQHADSEPNIEFLTPNK